jgi:hypothetical protein
MDTPIDAATCIERSDALSCHALSNVSSCSTGQPHKKMKPGCLAVPAEASMMLSSILDAQDNQRITTAHQLEAPAPTPCSPPSAGGGRHTDAAHSCDTPLQAQAHMHAAEAPTGTPTHANCSNNGGSSKRHRPGESLAPTELLASHAAPPAASQPYVAALAPTEAAPHDAVAHRPCSFQEAFERYEAKLEAAAACRASAPQRRAEDIIFSDPEMDETAGNEVRAYYKVEPRRRLIPPSLSLSQRLRMVGETLYGRCAPHAAAIGTLLLLEYHLTQPCLILNHLGQALGVKYLRICKT